MYEDHVVDTDVAQAQEQNAGGLTDAKAKTGKTVAEHLHFQHDQ